MLTCHVFKITLKYNIYWTFFQNVPVPTERATYICLEEKLLWGCRHNLCVVKAGDDKDADRLLFFCTQYKIM